MSEFKFGSGSTKKLNRTCIHIQEVMQEAIATSPWDFGITWGLRSAAEQYKLFRDGASKCDGYKILSRHQSGLAVDIVIYVNGKVTWDPKYYYAMAGHTLGTAKRLGIDLKFGGDWDMDGDLDDQTFNDLCHYEIVL